MTTTATMEAPAPGDSAGAGAQQAPTAFTLAAEGVVDYATGDAVMTMRFPGAGPMEMRVLGDVAYQKMPEEASGPATGGKPWAKIDMERLHREQYGASPAQMRSGATSDPTDQLGYLRGVSEGVEEVGEEKVRGVTTTHYEATIDPKKAAEQEEEQGAARRATEGMAEQIGSDEIPVEVWIDGEGRVRRYAMSVPLPNTSEGGSAAGGDVTVVQELYDFGVPVRVEPPPPEQTEDVTDEVLEQGSPNTTA